MLRMGSAEVSETGREIDACDMNVTALRGQDADGALRILERNEVLFEAGDLKTKFFRVEAGALCIYRTHPDLRIELIEHVLAGEIVGMGFLERHSANARATVETKVRCFDLDTLDELIEDDPHNKARYDEAMAREFKFRRESLVNSARERPMVRLAAFLVAVSNRSRDEGGDPTLIDDTVDCGVIADFLGLSVDLLALALMQLELRGLVETAPPHSLRLKDIDALEAIASEQVDGPNRVAWAASDIETRAAVQ